MRFFRVGLVAVSTLMVLASFGCAAKPNPEPTSTLLPVKIATQPWLGYGAWLIAEDQGYFADNGLDVTLAEYGSQAEIIEVLVSGEVDFLNISSQGALSLLAADPAAKIVLLEDTSTSATAIITNGDIVSLKELQGKKVAYEEGTTCDLLLQYALSQAGMSIADIKKVPTPSAEAWAALIEEKVSAAVTHEPYITQANIDNDRLRVIYEAGALTGLISDVLMVSDQFAEQQPEVVRALIKSWGQAVDYFDANRLEGLSIIAAGMGTTLEEVALGFNGITFFGISENQNLLVGDFAEATLPAIQSAALNAGLLDKEVELSGIIDGQFVN